MSTISYRIKSMQVTHSCIIPENCHKEGETQIFNTISFAMVLKDNSLLCNHGLILNKKGCPFVEITLETIFSISPDSIKELSTDTEGKMKIPQGFLIQCGSISYGTLRGIVLQRAEEKGLSNIIIPPVFMSNIIKGPMIVDLNK